MMASNESIPLTDYLSTEDAALRTSDEQDSMDYLPLASIIVVLVISIQCNSFVIAAFFRDARLRVLFNLFTVHLATADLLISILVIVALIDEITQMSFLGRWSFVCQVCAVLTNALPVEQLLLMHIICNDRHRAMQRGMSYTRSSFHWHIEKLVLFLTWVISFVGSFLITDVMSTIKLYGRGSCKFPGRLLYISYTSFVHFIMLVSLAVSTVCIIWDFKKRRQRYPQFERLQMELEKDLNPNLSSQSCNIGLQNKYSLQSLIPRSPVHVPRHFISLPSPVSHHPFRIKSFQLSPELVQLEFLKEKPKQLYQLQSPSFLAAQTSFSHIETYPNSDSSIVYDAQSTECQQKVLEMVVKEDLIKLNEQNEDDHVILKDVYMTHQTELHKLEQAISTEEGNNKKIELEEDDLQFKTLGNLDQTHEMDASIKQCFRLSVPDNVDNHLRAFQDAKTGDVAFKSELVEVKSLVSKGKHECRKNVRISDKIVHTVHETNEDIEQRTVNESADDLLPASFSFSDDELADFPIPRLRPRTDSLYTLRSCLSISEESLSKIPDEFIDVSSLSKSSPSNIIPNKNTKPLKDQKNDTKQSITNDGDEDHTETKTDIIKEKSDSTTSTPCLSISQEPCSLAPYESLHLCSSEMMINLKTTEVHDVIINKLKGGTADTVKEKQHLADVDLPLCVHEIQEVSLKNQSKPTELAVFLQQEFTDCPSTGIQLQHCSDRMNSDSGSYLEIQDNKNGILGGQVVEIKHKHGECEGHLINIDNCPNDNNNAGGQKSSDNCDNEESQTSRDNLDNDESKKLDDNKSERSQKSRDSLVNGENIVNEGSKKSSDNHDSEGSQKSRDNLESKENITVDSEDNLKSSDDCNSEKSALSSDKFNNAVISKSKGNLGSEGNMKSSHNIFSTECTRLCANLNKEVKAKSADNFDSAISVMPNQNLDIKGSIKSADNFDNAKNVMPNQNLDIKVSIKSADNFDNAKNVMPNQNLDIKGSIKSADNFDSAKTVMPDQNRDIKGSIKSADNFDSAKSVMPNQNLDIKGSIKSADNFDSAISVMPNQNLDIKGSIKSADNFDSAKSVMPNQNLDIKGSIKSADNFDSAKSIMPNQNLDIKGSIKSADNFDSAKSVMPNQNLDIKGSIKSADNIDSAKSVKQCQNLDIKGSLQTGDMSDSANNVMQSQQFDTKESIKSGDKFDSEANIKSSNNIDSAVICKPHENLGLGDSQKEQKDTILFETPLSVVYDTSVEMPAEYSPAYKTTEKPTLPEMMNEYRNPSSVSCPTGSKTSRHKYAPDVIDSNVLHAGSFQNRFDSGSSSYVYHNQSKKHPVSDIRIVNDERHYLYISNDSKADENFEHSQKDIEVAVENWFKFYDINLTNTNEHSECKLLSDNKCIVQFRSWQQRIGVPPTGGLTCCEALERARKIWLDFYGIEVAEKNMTSKHQLNGQLISDVGNIHIDEKPRVLKICPPLDRKSQTEWSNTNYRSICDTAKDSVRKAEKLKTAKRFKHVIKFKRPKENSHFWPDDFSKMDNQVVSDESEHFPYDLHKNITTTHHQYRTAVGLHNSTRPRESIKNETSFEGLNVSHSENQKYSVRDTAVWSERSDNDLWKDNEQNLFENDSADEPSSTFEGNCSSCTSFSSKRSIHHLEEANVLESSVTELGIPETKADSSTTPFVNGTETLRCRGMRMSTDNQGKQFEVSESEEMCIPDKHQIQMTTSKTKMIKSCEKGEIIQINTYSKQTEDWAESLDELSNTLNLHTAKSTEHSKDNCVFDKTICLNKNPSDTSNHFLVDETTNGFLQEKYLPELQDFSLSEEKSNITEAALTTYEMLESMSISCRAFLVELGIYRDILLGRIPLNMEMLQLKAIKHIAPCPDCERREREREQKISSMRESSAKDSDEDATGCSEDDEMGNTSSNAYIHRLEFVPNSQTTDSVAFPHLNVAVTEHEEISTEAGQERSPQAGRFQDMDPEVEVSRTLSGTSTVNLGNYFFVRMPRGVPHRIMTVCRKFSFEELKVSDPEMCILLSLVCIVLLQLVCWLPIAILYMIFDVTGFPFKPSKTELALLCLWCLRMVVQPLLYVCYSKYFRENYVQLLRCKYCR